MSGRGDAEKEEKYITYTYIMYICINTMVMRKFRNLLLSLSALLIISCVNEDYDLEKIKTDELAGLKGLTLPVGSTERFFLHDFLKNDDGTLKTDAAGNYYFSISGEAQAEGFTIPYFRFDGFLETNSQHSLSEIPLIIENIAQYPDFVTETVNFKDFIFSINIDQSDLPKDVIDISYADVEADIAVDFHFDTSELPFEKLWISSGTRITFPECVILGQVPEELVKIKPNVVEFANHFPITSSGSSVSCPIDAIDFQYLPEDQGITSPGTLFIDQDAVISGGFFLKAADCLSEGIFYPEIESALTVGTIEIQSVKAALAIDESTFEVDKEFEVKDLPEFIDDAFCLDFNNLRLNLALVNDSPFAASMNAEITTGTSDETYWNSVLYGLSFGPYATSRFSVSDGGSGGPEGYKDLALPGFNSIMNKIPELISLQTALEFPQELYDIIPGSEYSFGMEYSLEVPMSFGDNLSISMTEEITGLNVSIEGVSLPKAVLACDIITTLPLMLHASALPIDVEGNVIDDIAVETKGSITGGNMDSPSVSHIEIVLSSKGELAFDGVRLSISASSIQESAVLNENQYIQVADISLTIPEGVGYVM